jgi:hypothetical protein
VLGYTYHEVSSRGSTFGRHEKCISDFGQKCFSALRWVTCHCYNHVVITVKVQLAFAVGGVNLHAG